MPDTNSVLISEKLIAEVHTKMTTSIDLEKVIHTIGITEEELRTMYLAAVEESRKTLSLLKDIQLVRESKVLEVGAGFGLASICLAMMGFDVVALEPGGLGFEQNKSASRAFASSCAVEIKHVSASAEDTDFGDFGKFDLVVSNNVLEHIPNFDKALTNLIGAISPGGMMIHSCPNYAFPFEPHFGIPLVPFFPHLTMLFLPRSICRSGLWKSLNFVSVRQVKRVLRNSDYSVKFKRGRMVKSFSRLNEDTQFRSRHKMLGKIAQNRFIFWLFKRLLNLPIWIATPMDFIVVHSSMSEDSKVLSWLSS